MSDGQPRNSEEQDKSGKPAQSNERVTKLEVNHGVFVTLAQVGYQTPSSGMLLMVVRVAQLTCSKLSCSTWLLEHRPHITQWRDIYIWNL